MKDGLIQEVYDSLRGELVIPLPGIENAFVQGGKCDCLYGQMLQAYDRICHRLAVEEEAPDVETIINALLDIQEELCEKMFLYGMKFGKGLAE